MENITHITTNIINYFYPIIQNIPTNPNSDFCGDDKDLGRNYFRN